MTGMYYVNCIGCCSGDDFFCTWLHSTKVVGVDSSTFMTLKTGLFLFFEWY